VTMPHVLQKTSPHSKSDIKGLLQIGHNNEFSIQNKTIL